MLVSGLSRSGSADASGKRDHVDATGGQSKAQEDAVAKPATTGESIVIPFGVLAIDDGDKATQRREDLTDTHGETQHNPPAIGRDLQVRVPMTSTKLADAPELDVTQLQRLAGVSFRHKVDSFYRATSTSERRGD